MFTQSKGTNFESYFLLIGRNHSPPATAGGTCGVLSVFHASKKQTSRLCCKPFNKYNKVKELNCKALEFYLLKITQSG